MFSYLFLEEEVLKFRYDMKALKAIQDLEIDIFNDDLENLTLEQLERIAFIGLSDIGYKEYIELLDDNFNKIFNFALEAISNSFSYKTQDYEDDYDEDLEGVDEKQESKFEIDELLEAALEVSLSVKEFWESTPKELYKQIKIITKRIKDENNNSISLEYLNAYLQRSKKMPPISKFIKKEKKIMTDEEMYAKVVQLNNSMNKE